MRYGGRSWDGQSERFFWPITPTTCESHWTSGARNGSLPERIGESEGSTVGRSGGSRAGWIVTLRTERIRTLDQLRAFLEGNEAADFQPTRRDSAYALVRRILVRFEYHGLRKPDKGLVKRVSREGDGPLQGPGSPASSDSTAGPGTSATHRGKPPAHAFARRYTPYAAALLAEDRALVSRAGRGGPGPGGSGRELARGSRPAPQGRAGRAGQGTPTAPGRSSGRCARPTEGGCGTRSGAEGRGGATPPALVDRDAERARGRSIPRIPPRLPAPGGPERGGGGFER